VAAGVLTGVGFLGAGAIIKTGDVVRGLTTAASIWLMTGLGMAVGLGFYVEAWMTTLVALIVLSVAARVDALTRANQYYSITTRLEADRAPAGEDRILAILRGLPGASSQVTARRVDLAAGTADLTFSLKSRGQTDSKGVTAAIAAVEGVRHVTWT
jgi:putative Mg2+ transporter-C (MgtC) family protein